MVDVVTEGEQVKTEEERTSCDLNPERGSGLMRWREESGELDGVERCAEVYYDKDVEPASKERGGHL